ncbi:MAG TPA: glycoside hydrolase family 2 [Lachnospiraceae bacterium]|jgi:beta-galactosidase/beta-glucuronidase|nr:glycoside hydrolase family 2 [Lachnospiraceae bacterium]HCM11837.1 glycoside hydrolase family 2 [Lachnospiraceae bacterium]
MLNEYPRPQFERDDWTNLNGEWNFVFDDENAGEADKWYQCFPSARKILVPYTYETALGTIDDPSYHQVIWYNRKVDLTTNGKERIILNFEGVDYLAKVWVNGSFAGVHTGGYVAFSLDISKVAVDGENDITIRVEDSFSCVQPRGKQRWKEESFGCWYVQTTGIWKTVWLEKVPSCYLANVKITPDIDHGEVSFYAKVVGRKNDTDTMLCCEITLEDQEVCSTNIKVDADYVSFKLSLANENEPWKVALWSPDNPRLYDVKLTLSEGGANTDRVKTYFGMRKISIDGNKILLNNRPLYQRLILDQGYWKESHLTPPSEEAIIKDIELIKEAGYNGLRKHQKIEDRRFLYWCDRKGLLVWSEMAAQYTFNEDAMKVFTKEWMEVVEQNYNHPSIIIWTPFNESWGVERIYSDKRQQKFTEAIYHLTKAFDPMRPVIVNDGWEHTVSDIVTLHDYSEWGEEIADRYADPNEILYNRIPFNKHRYAFAEGYSYQGQPVIISEYGGIAFDSKEGWGYGRKVQTGEDFLERFDSLTSAIQRLDYVCGFCYTQLTDVQQEVNGLYTIDREPKVNIAKVKKINETCI